MALHHLASSSHHDDVAVLDDVRLVELARARCRVAFEELYRRHLPAAQRVARRFCRPADVDDVVSEAFGQLLGQLDRGRGPHSDLRSYLLASVRHEAGRRARKAARGFLTDDETVFERANRGDDEPTLGEREVVRRAFRSLPERWRTVLWMLEVEGLKPREVATDLDMRPNSVSALAYRARAAFRVAYLEEHVSQPARDLPERCRPTRAHLVDFVRRELTLPGRRTVHLHVRECDACAVVLDELVEVAERIPALAPNAPVPAVGTSNDLARRRGAEDRPAALADLLGA